MGARQLLPRAAVIGTETRTYSRSNVALRAAQGEILAFTDDDCRLSKDYVNDLLRHDAGDAEPVLRGGRIELGDPTDLPLTIRTTPDRIRWNRRENSAHC